MVCCSIQYNPNLKPPYDTGFELVGEVVAIGDAVNAIQLGNYVVARSARALCLHFMGY